VKRTPWSILIAIVLAAIVGTISGKETAVFGITLFSIFDLVGKLFINALTLVVVPLVASSIITGIAHIGNDASFRRLGLKTFGFYLLTSFLAILIGVVLVNLLEPGQVAKLPDQTLVPQEKLAKVSEGHQVGLGNLLLEAVPTNIVEAFAKGNMLGLIVFSLLFGYAMTKIEAGYLKTLLSFWKGIFETMIGITRLVMKCLPLGVFCLVAKVFADSGLKSLHSVWLFFITVIVGLALFVCVALPLLLKFVGKVSPIAHIRAMGPALLTAFSTSSSSASLPVTLDCAEKRAGVSNRICSFVIPLGTSMNLAGSALYEAVAALFVAQVYGIELSFVAQLTFALVTLLISMGMAGVPSASLVAIVVILKAMGLPIEGIGFFIAVDRILDMCRTTVNVFSDSCCAVLVAKSEGEKGILKS
jgi:proton glutamate symport protein